MGGGRTLTAPRRAVRRRNAEDERLGHGRSIRADPRGDNVVLFTLTGYIQEGDLQKSAKAGFDHHLVKPVDIDALMGCWRGCSRRRPLS